MVELEKIIQAIADAGGIAYEVGGCVRDQILKKPNKDFDIEVFHLDAAALTKILARFGRVNEVGVSFGVIKLHPGRGDELDFTLPRRESKSGRGHRGFPGHLRGIQRADGALRTPDPSKLLMSKIHFNYLQINELHSILAQWN